MPCVLLGRMIDTEIWALRWAGNSHPVTSAHCRPYGNGSALSVSHVNSDGVNSPLARLCFGL